MKLKLGKKEVFNGGEPYFIAEMSGNHNQSIERALEIVKAAADSGADALKVQTYTAETMTLNIKGDGFDITDKSSLWHGKNLYDLYKEAYTPWEWHQEIKNYAEKLGMDFFSTPFDSSAVKFLEGLNVPFYKIASFENTDHPLLEEVGKTGKPVIMSTGMASLSEIEESVKVLRESGAQDIVLLKCTSAYPAPYEQINLKTIPYLKDLFNVVSGLSDHTLGSAVPVASVSLGAAVIEKHFTLKREDGGVDSAFSLEPAEFQSMVEDSKNAWRALGQVSFGRTEIEEKSMIYRRSLYFSKSVKTGDIVSRDCIRAIRPGLGLPPKHLKEIIGKKVTTDIEAGTPVKMDHFYSH